MSDSDTITITATDYNDYSFDSMTSVTTLLDDTITLNGATGSIYTTNNTGYVTISPPIGSNGVFVNSGSGYSFTNPTTETSIKVGEEFSIVASHDSGAKLIYKDQEMEIGQLFGMFNAFKVLLKSVAEDPDFCNKHPEIRDMAYGYLIEELKK